jgi:putative transposase
MRELASHSVARMADLLTVSRSGYYAWKKREQAGPSPAQQRRQQLTTKIIDCHEASDQVYGSPRILADLRDDGEQVSRKTVAKLMRSNGIVGISPRGWTPTTTLPDLGATSIPDLVERRFDQGDLNRVWTSDITYLDTNEGWLYLCAVRDGCSRRVLGWSIQDHLRADLVDQALTMAVVLRGVLPDKVVFHADRGTQASTPRPRSPSSAPASASSNPWAGPGAGTTQPPNRSGPPSKPSSTTGTTGPPKPKHDSPSAAGSKNGTTVAAATRRWP